MADTTEVGTTETKEVSKDATASAKDAESREAGKPSDADKKSDAVDDATGLKKALQATRKERDEALKALRDGELAKLPELERYKSMADELTKENEKLTKANMRMQVALELGLPWKLGKRLEGESIEDMRSDGADLLKDYRVSEGGRVVDKDDPKNKKLPTNDTKKSGASGSMSMDDKLRSLAGRQLR